MAGGLVGVVVGLVVGAGTAALLLQHRLRQDRAALRELGVRLEEASVAQARLAELRAHLSGLRHDMRGILSPAMLVANRLVDHAEPGVRRAGDVMIRTVERAVARLAETRQLLPSEETPEV